MYTDFIVRHFGVGVNLRNLRIRKNSLVSTPELRLIQKQMNPPLYDAHAHLPEKYLHTPHSHHSVINGTSPADWSAVLELSRKDSRALPAIGLHPQQVQRAPDNWKATFLQFLNNDSVSAIGEIGLDRRNPQGDIERQLDAFSWQLEQAHARNLPVSIHCLKAVGLLMDTLRNQHLPTRGIHLHAYNGPVELIAELSEIGAYFSFNAKQLEPASPKVISRIRAIPIQRLLIETDLAYNDNSSQLHKCYATVARIRELRLEAFAEQVAVNFEHYFLNH